MKKISWKAYLLATLIIIFGLGGQLLLSLWIEPKVFNKDVVKVKADSSGIAEYTELTAADLYIARVPNSEVPDHAFETIDNLVGKSTIVKLTDGMILTETLIDVNKLLPQVGEGVYALPKDAIYAINGSLRANDSVKIDLVIPSESRLNAENPIEPVSETFIEKVKVAYVRTDSNNDVMDTEDGKTTDRRTSTGKVSYPEVLLTDEQGKALKDKLEAGYKLWIVRVQ